MSLNGPRKPIRRKPRTPSEYARIYGGKARVEWVASLPCVAAHHGCVGPIQGHHIKTDGTSRKADARFIVPLCRFHHDEVHHGVASFQRKYGVNLAAEAERVDAAWTQRVAA
jgi:hypothetical protein